MLSVQLQTVIASFLSCLISDVALDIGLSVCPQGQNVKFSGPPVICRWVILKSVRRRPERL